MEQENLLKKYHISESQLQETRKQLKKLYEYSFYMPEDEGNDMDQQPMPQQGAPAPNGQAPAPQDPMAQDGMSQGDMGQQPMGQDPMTQDGMPQGDMGQQPTGQEPNMMGDMGQQPMGQDPNMADNIDIDDGMGNEPIEDVEMDGGAEPMQPEDEVIDVDDLTQSQETTEYKLDGVSEKLTTLLDVASKFVDALEKNDKKIEALKAELERRNPTEQEKLNIRSQASQPYGETPKDFWERKQAENPHYNIMFDNDVPTNKEDEEFVLRKKDINDSDSMSVYKSLEDYPTKLKDVLSF